METRITSSTSREQFTAPAQSPGGTLVADRTAEHRPDRPTRWHVPGGWPLLPVLIVQTLLTLRLVRADTAHQDEALYLWAGHLQWASWLHGTAIPPFAYYFSGAPVIYPPLGALADHAGGLAGARILSLVFMLGATTLLWSTARHRYGRRAAFFAAALFAVLGPTLHLGAFATYKALSLFLVALAAWCVLRAGDRGVLPGRMIAAGAALALASATAYSTVLFDVLVAVLAVLGAFPAPGGRVALRRAAILLATVIALLGAGLLIGGSNYLNGFKVNILTPVAHTSSPLVVLSSTWYWAGILVILAAGGVVISAVRREGRAATWLLAVLAAAAILGPAEQAWLHTAALLNEHVGVGAWFAAIAAGYAADRFIAAVPGRAGAGGHQRGLRDRAGVPGVPGRGAVAGVRDQLAQRDRVHQRVPAAGRPQHRADAGGRPLDRQVLPAIRAPVAALVQHPQHRPALRGQHRDHHRHHRRRQRRDLRLLHRARLLRLRGPQLHRHHRAGPRPGHRTAPQPPLPHHRRRPLRHRGQARRPGHLRDLEIRARPLSKTGQAFPMMLPRTQ